MLAATPGPGEGMKEYLVWITPPQQESGLFRLNIHPRLPLSPRPDRIAQTLLTREEFVRALTRNLPKGQNSVQIVERIITGALTKTFDLKSKGPITLSDKAAHGLGWEFSTESSPYSLKLLG